MRLCRSRQASMSGMSLHPKLPTCRRYNRWGFLSIDNDAGNLLPHMQCTCPAIKPDGVPFAWIRNHLHNIGNYSRDLVRLWQVHCCRQLSCKPKLSTCCKGAMICESSVLQRPGSARLVLLDQSHEHADRVLSRWTRLAISGLHPCDDDKPLNRVVSHLTYIFCCRPSMEALLRQWSSSAASHR